MPFPAGWRCWTAKPRAALQACRISLQLALDLRSVVEMLWALPYFLQVLGSAEHTARVRAALETTTLIDPWVQWQLQRLPESNAVATKYILVKI
ncbi:hypothetical protein [Deinococcus ruber]|uniref:Uncharacterized protein n=1 Tax=Deinococcus ruber TaxID=1848197 RepID=A0A918CIR2_9DEIO|nr:hypothetical protein [Deinococcus ruber]GGR23627.1 hypothetical protein GCM10008957_39380 [Deinococcus ruber]